jgi:DeoR/GlpR family transcriptional regulator of sugar metabolism
VLAHERRSAVLRMVTRAGSATVAELAAALEVSDMTIRRDLVALAEKRLIEKVYGGAVLPRRSAIEPHFVAKRTLNAGAKEAIGARAVELVRDGMTISLSAGTTTWQVAKQLDHRFHNLTFITNSMNVAMALEDNGWSSVVVSGGSFRTPSDALVGPFAVQTLRQLNADLLFLGVDSLDPSVGLTTPNIPEAETDRALIAGARQVVVVADSSKLGQVSLATFGSLDDVDVLITDTRADSGVLQSCRAAGLEVLVVEPVAEPKGVLSRIG